MTDNTTTTAQQLASEVGGEFVQAKRYGRIVIGRRTLVYVNPTHLDFKASDIAKAPKAAKAKLTIKGDRAQLPLAELKVAGTLLKHVAEATAPLIDGSDEHDAAVKSS